VESQVPAIGTISALEPIVRACSAVWIAHASGTADRGMSDKEGRILLPPGKPEYALKRLWLSREEEQGYYYGFSNEGIWPLCHFAHVRPIFRNEDWQQYIEVNAKFANAYMEEIKSSQPVLLIQDFHFASLPAMIRKLRPTTLIGLFWHIPWPNAEALRICPFSMELISGMLGADVIGFQSQIHCNNFMDSVERFLEAKVSRDQFKISYQGHSTLIKPFPASIEWPSRHQIIPGKFLADKNTVLDEFSIQPDAIIGVGVDRLDYTKGIIEKFQAIERTLQKHTQLVGKLTFIQILSPSRMHLKRYQDLSSDIQKEADRINWKYSSAAYQPILLQMEHYDGSDLARFYRAANFCYVNPIHDGMNLVAKEFVSSRNDENGVLILSCFAGSAGDLKEAIIVNPYDIDECADAIYRAVQMSPEEQRQKMKRMRDFVSTNNTFTWGYKMFHALHDVSHRRGLTGEIESEGPDSYRS